MSPEKKGPVERSPAEGAKAALLTKNGIIAGVLASWSETAAVVEASAEGLAGSEVLLRVQGQERIWEKRAIVLWVHNDYGVGLEFEPDSPAKKGLIQRVLDSMSAATEHGQVVRPATQSQLKREGLDNHEPGILETNPSTRRRLRTRIQTPAEVIRVDDREAGADITTITDASSSGILFTTNQAYSVGTRLLVKYPYPNSNFPRQRGKVVRVEKLPDGRRRVAVQFAPTYELAKL